MYESREVKVETMRIEDASYLSYHHRWEGAIRRISAGLRTTPKRKQRDQHQFWMSLHHKIDVSLCCAHAIKKWLGCGDLKDAGSACGNTHMRFAYSLLAIPDA